MGCRGQWREWTVLIGNKKLCFKSEGGRYKRRTELTCKGCYVRGLGVNLLKETDIILVLKVLKSLKY